ncbi:MAG: ABC transporter substrate-binding protein [Candidatus Hodarchaeota archaeon]
MEAFREIGWHRMIVMGTLVLSLMIGQLIILSAPAVAYEPPAPYFKVTLLAPTNTPHRALAAQVIAAELWKIGIDAELVLVGYDALIPRLFKSQTFEPYAGDGFDIGFVGWAAGDPDRTNLPLYFHSRAIDKAAGGNNLYPINNSRLDAILDKLDGEPQIKLRQQYIQQALDIIIWENHPVLGLYQAGYVQAMDTAFDVTYPSAAGFFFEDDKQEVFIAREAARFSNLNPVFAKTLDDIAFFDVIAHSSLYRRDRDSIIRPLLAAADPIPIGSNDVIAELVDPSTIAPDSPYKTKTIWGPNPNIDAAQHNANVVAANYSMLLIRLREGIPWHPGYGYTEAMKLNATVNDLLWTRSYLQNEELPNSDTFSTTWGPDYARAFEKINDTLVKVNFQGPLGNGIVPTWFSELLFLTFLPQHILDPTFNATHYGGAVGVTPDGTPILPYAEQERYRYNSGEGDRPIPNTGPYYMEGWDESQQIATYQKFPDWGGYGNSSLWNNSPFLQNNIETIGLSVITDPNKALLALEKGEIDWTVASVNDVAYLRSLPNIKVRTGIVSGIQTMSYNTMHPQLNNRYVRLAISHLVPSENIVRYIMSGLGMTNEIVGVPRNSDFYPKEDEWSTLGLNQSENVKNHETGEMLEFQGHICYSEEKAWALMEKAGYDMTAFRDAVRREGEGQYAEQGVDPLPILLASAATLGVVSLAVIVSRRYWHRYLAAEPKTLHLSRQRKLVQEAMRLKKSARIVEKAKAQEIFQQIAKEDIISPDLTIYAMLNLCDLLLDEVKAYGAESVLHEADKLAIHIDSIAREQDSPALQVEVLILRSKFALLKGTFQEVEQLLSQAAAVAEDHHLLKLTTKVTSEKNTIEAELNRWEDLLTQAASLRERIEETRLQDYVANAMKLIELEGNVT